MLINEDVVKTHRDDSQNQLFTVFPTLYSTVINQYRLSKCI